MWPKLAVAGVLLLVQGAVADDCLHTVSVLDVAGVQCVSSAPCSGTYYASGLTQGVGACPTGASCALLPETPIMGCAASGRSDLIYVNADGTLTKDGKSATLPGASSTPSDSTTTAPSSSGTSSTTSSSSKSTASSSTDSSNNGSNASSGSNFSTKSGSDGGSEVSNASADSSNSTADSASSAASNSSSSTSNSGPSDSGSGSITISPGSSSANQQSFNPGSILSDGSNPANSSLHGGLGIGSIIAIVVGCLAVVAIAAGARLLRKGKEAELATPDAAVAMDGYNNGGGGGGMTPKENVLLL